MISSDLYIFSMPCISACHGKVAIHIWALIVRRVIWLQPKIFCRIFLKKLGLYLSSRYELLSQIVLKVQLGLKTLLSLRQSELFIKFILTSAGRRNTPRGCDITVRGVDSNAMQVFYKVMRYCVLLWVPTSALFSCLLSVWLMFYISLVSLHSV